MKMDDAAYSIGSIVKARSREWIVQSGSTPQRLKLRPLSGSDADETVIVPSLEPVPPTSASFAPPDPTKRGNAAQAELMRDALRMKLRSGAGPFRSFGNLGVSPRPYQLVPLLMALKMPVTRLLVADDVGIGKTIEAALVVRELFDRGEISRFAVLCPPHLVDQWTSELKRHFHFNAVALTSRTVMRLERDIPVGESIFDHYKAVVISLDYIKSEKHRDNFLSAAPELIVVDEAHTCSHGGAGTQYRYDLVRKLAEDSSRHMLLLTATPHSGDREAFYRLIALLKPEFHALMEERKDDKQLRAELGRHFVQRHRIDIENDWNGKSIFPQRLTKEVDYSLTPDWSSYLKLIYEHCQELARRASEKGVHATFYGYTAINEYGDFGSQSLKVSASVTKDGKVTAKMGSRSFSCNGLTYDRYNNTFGASIKSSSKDKKKNVTYTRTLFLDFDPNVDYYENSLEGRYIEDYTKKTGSGISAVLVAQYDIVGRRNVFGHNANGGLLFEGADVAQEALDLASLLHLSASVSFGGGSATITLSETGVAKLAGTLYGKSFSESAVVWYLGGEGESTRYLRIWSFSLGMQITYRLRYLSDGSGLYLDSVDAPSAPSG